MWKQLKIIFMNEVKVVSVTPDELVELINEGIKTQLQAYTARINSKVQTDERPHLTKRETARFFDVSINCITDWTNQGKLKSFRMGQRVYYSKKECIDKLFKNEIK